MLAGELESAINKIKLIGRLQDEMIGLTAAVEVEQRSALHKLQLSAAKARDHRTQNMPVLNYSCSCAYDSRRIRAGSSGCRSRTALKQSNREVGVQSWVHRDCMLDVTPQPWHCSRANNGVA